MKLIYLPILVFALIHLTLYGGDCFAYKSAKEIALYQNVQDTQRVERPVNITGGTYDYDAESVLIMPFKGKASIKIEY